MSLRENLRAAGVIPKRESKVTESQVAELREEMVRRGWDNDVLRENLATLEMQMREEGWRQTTNAMRREFTRDGLGRLIEMSRAMYLSHPLIQRAVNVRAYYTWGQGINVKADNDTIQKQVIDPLHKDPLNKAELFSHQSAILTDVDQQTDGNIFVALFTNMAGDVQIRTLPTDEIRQIIRSPDDYAQVQFYRRVYVEEQFDTMNGVITPVTQEVYYPDINFTPMNKPRTINGRPVRWDAPVVHQRTGGLKHMAFGVPETYAALDWARAYRKFLEDWHTIVASLARFAWQKTTKGSKIKRAAERLRSTITADEDSESTLDETNWPGPPGAVHVSGENDTMVPIQKSGASTSAEDAKPSRLMVASAMDLPDTILSGDPQQGNLATAKTLDRPTELAISSRQEMWCDFRLQIYHYAVEARKKRGRTRDARKVAEAEADIEVTFPDILEHDEGDAVMAVVNAATLAGKSDAGTIPKERLARMLMEELGVNSEDIEKALEELTQQEQEELQQAAQSLKDMQAAAAAQGGPAPGAVPPADDPVAAAAKQAAKAKAKAAGVPPK